MNKWIGFDSPCLSDRVTCSLPIWTSSLPLPKHAVIYGSWALRSCALWCLIQGPTTKEGGERGCVENSPGLGSSGTLISDKYSLCCSLQSLWLQRSNSCMCRDGDDDLSLDFLLCQPHWSKKSFDALKNYEVFLKRPRWKPAIIVKFNQRPVLSALSSNGNTLIKHFAARPPQPHFHYLWPPLFIFLTHMVYLSFSLSLSPFAGRS